jgi:hypothetical protein
MEAVPQAVFLFPAKHDGINLPAVEHNKLPAQQNPGILILIPIADRYVNEADGLARVGHQRLHARLDCGHIRVHYKIKN